METEKTLGILRNLADGIDPGTGEKFPVASAYQHPDTVRALFSAIRLLESPAARPAKPAAVAGGRPAPENAGRAWSEEEDARLGGGYDSGKSIDELAALHKRSKWAVESRLARLGKIPEPPSRFPARNTAGSTATA